MRRSFVGVVMTAMTGGLLAAGSIPAGAAASSPLHSSSVKLAGTVRVSSLPRVTGRTAGSGALHQLPALGHPGNNPGAANGASGAESRTPLLGIAPGTQLTPALADSDNTAGLTPPDMGVGADTTHVVQMVNVVGRIWTNHVAGSAFQLNAFFLAGANFLSDPWVLFDQESGRWFSGIFDVTLGGERFGVSQTGDPTGSWFIYAVQYPGVTGGGCPDQGKGGIDSNVVALGFNEYSGNQCTGGFLGGAIEVFNKAQMMAGASVNFASTNPNTAWFSMVPAQSLSSGQTTQYFASNDANSTSKALHRVTTTGVPGVSTVSLTTLPDITLKHTYPTPPAAPQPGTTKKLASGDQRMQHVVFKSGVGLAMSWTEKCKPAGDTAARDCARVITTNDGVGGPVATSDHDWAAKGMYYVYPAATFNSVNDIVVTFGATSGTVFPQLDAAAATVGATSFGAPIVLVTGTTANTTGRYGDYFAVALDPGGTAPNQNVWAAGEIGGPIQKDWQSAVREVNVTP